MTKRIIGLIGLALSLLLMIGCSAEKVVESGDTVKVHYTGTLEDGSVFDSSEGRDPLEFEVGTGSLIPGFENGVYGMKVGEKKTIDIPVDQAYGQRHEELVGKIPRSQFPPDMTLEIGQTLQIPQPDGRAMNAVVAEMDDSTVTLDGNHPLAGKNLKFEIEIVEIIKKS
jgi:FKBP-type peptidyl-prolyl cis-trans isomerase 2